MNSIREAYDDQPYRSFPYPLSAVEHIAAVAFALGFSPAFPTQCRVIELGCGSGLNLIPMAMRNPNSSFLGVDLSPVQIAIARKSAEHLRIGNIKFIASDLRDIVFDTGTYDYIVCHGVFSWVPAAVQDAILSQCNAALAPRGIAYVSYNTYPGWKAREMLRDAMRMRVGSGRSNAHPVSLARGMIDYLATSGSASGPLRAAIEADRDMIATADTAYIAHDFLSEHNNPVYLADFAERAARFGLHHLVDSQIEISLPEGYSDTASGPALAEAGEDHILFEQFIDFASNRQFRQSLLVKNEGRAHVRPAIVLDRLRQLCFYAMPTLRDAALREFFAKRGSRAASFNKIDSFLRARVAQPERGSCEAFLEEAICRGHVRCTFADDADVDADASASDIDPLWIAESWRRFAEITRADGQPFLVTNRHAPLLLDPVEEVLIPELDGRQRDLALVDRLLDAAGAGMLSFVRDGKPIIDAAEQRSMAIAHVQTFRARYRQRFGGLPPRRKLQRPLA